MVSRAIRYKIDWQREITAAILAVLVMFAGFKFAPAHWFLDIKSIEVVQTESGKTVVILTRSVFPEDSVQVRWVAQVERIADAYAEVVCWGDGHATIRDDVVEVIRLPLEDFIGDPDCRPAPGTPHIVEASWTFRVFGFTKTAHGRSPAFTLIEGPGDPA